MKENVYHSSYIKGLKEISPQVSGLFDKPHIFAAKDILISTVFLRNKKNNFGDFSYWKGRSPDTGKVTIVEMYTGAFKDSFENVSGSIYVLPGDDFIEGKTKWIEEVVCENAIKPLKEIDIENMF